jgi:predicted small integral membrane protein
MERLMDIELVTRASKICCVAAMGLYAALVAFGNITDYWTNFEFVTDILDMDKIPSGSHIHWRALKAPWLHHATYIIIIAVESVTSIFCLLGALGMARQINADPRRFRRSKAKAVVGLTLGFLLYEGGFVAIGGEWFGMWQAGSFDAVPSAFRILITILGILIFVSLKDEDLG